MRIGVLLLLLVSVPTRASAWGVAAHRYIMGRAIDLLPAEIKPFFDRYRDELVLRVNDPDTWRVAGWDDGPNHFVNFGLPDLGPYPFAAFPRDYSAAVEKFGLEPLKRIGMLPWREAEEFGNLRRAFEGFRRDDHLRSERRPCCLPRSPATTCRTRTCRCTPATTTTGS